MPRLRELQDVMFEVALRPLFASVDGEPVSVRDHHAVVAEPGRRVLGIVGRAYRLVTHAQALELARECARAAFPETAPAEWQVAQVDAPSTGSSCFIDLAHNSAALDFSGLPAHDRPEVYGPFVRVTNSYNRSRALGFDIGYSRKVCRNGLILRSALISFRMNHERREIREAVRFEIAHEKLARQKRQFQDFLGRLQKCEVPADDVAGFARGVLGFSPPSAELPAHDGRHDAWVALATTVDAAAARYVKELGPTAYAVLNVVTELASRPPDNPLLRRDRHALQRRAGEWASEFAAACAQPGFDLRRYLAQRAGGAAAGRPAAARS